MSRDHLHDGFPVTDPDGRGVDTALLGQLTGAAFDGCKPCQADLLAAVADHAPTTARAVEMVCSALHAELGGLPDNLINPDRLDVLASVAFRHLATAGLDGRNERMFEVAATMDLSDRAAAVDTALDMMIGLLAGKVAAQLGATQR